MTYRQKQESLKNLWQQRLRMPAILLGSLLFVVATIVGNYPTAYPWLYSHLQPTSSLIGVEQNWRVFTTRFSTVFTVRLDISYSDGSFSSDIVRKPQVVFTRSEENRLMEYLSFETNPAVLGSYLEAVCKEKSTADKKVIAVSFLRSPLIVGHMDDPVAVPVNQVRYQPHFYHICDSSL